MKSRTPSDLARIDEKPYAIFIGTIVFSRNTQRMKYTDMISALPKALDMFADKSREIYGDRPVSIFVAMPEYTFTKQRAMNKSIFEACNKIFAQYAKQYNIHFIPGSLLHSKTYNHDTRIAQYTKMMDRCAINDPDGSILSEEYINGNYVLSQSIRNFDAPLIGYTNKATLFSKSDGMVLKHSKQYPWHELSAANHPNHLLGIYRIGKRGNTVLLRLPSTHSDRDPIETSCETRICYEQGFQCSDADISFLLSDTTFIIQEQLSEKTAFLVHCDSIRKPCIVFNAQHPLSRQSLISSYDIQIDKNNYQMNESPQISRYTLTELSNAVEHDQAEAFRNLLERLSEDQRQIIFYDWFTDSNRFSIKASCQSNHGFLQALIDLGIMNHFPSFYEKLYYITAVIQSHPRILIEYLNTNHHSKTNILHQLMADHSISIEEKINAYHLLMLKGAIEFYNEDGKTALEYAIENAKADEEVHALKQYIDETYCTHPYAFHNPLSIERILLSLFKRNIMCGLDSYNRFYDFWSPSNDLELNHQMSLAMQLIDIVASNDLDDFESFFSNPSDSLSGRQELVVKTELLSQLLKSHQSVDITGILLNATINNRLSIIKQVIEAGIEPDQFLKISFPKRFRELTNILFGAGARLSKHVISHLDPLLKLDLQLNQLISFLRKTPSTFIESPSIFHPSFTMARKLDAAILFRQFLYIDDSEFKHAMCILEPYYEILKNSELEPIFNAWQEHYKDRTLSIQHSMQP